MNGRRVRLAILTPLAVSSLALGAVTFSAGTAGAASPSCGLSKTGTADVVQVTGKDFRPNKQVALESGAGNEGTVRSDANGGWSLQVGKAEGTITAQQIGGPEVRCGTVEETEQNDARAQFKQGYKEGFADMKADCRKNQRQGVAADPNWQEGYDKGSAAAERRYCED